MAGGAAAAPVDVPQGVQEVAEVVSARPVGAYTHLVLRAPEAARRARPGQFVACGTGDSGMLLRRSLSLHAADPEAGTLEVVVAAAGPGTRLLAAKRPGDVVPTTAPLGRPFPLPAGRAPRPSSSAAATAPRRCPGWPASWQPPAAASSASSGPPAPTGCWAPAPSTRPRRWTGPTAPPTPWW